MTEHECDELSLAIKERYPYLIIDITLEYDGWYLSLYEDFENRVKIKHCPFCGAKLE